MMPSRQRKSIRKLKTEIFQLRCVLASGLFSWAISDVIPGGLMILRLILPLATLLLPGQEWIRYPAAAFAFLIAASFTFGENLVFHKVFPDGRISKNIRWDWGFLSALSYAGNYLWVFLTFLMAFVEGFSWGRLLSGQLRESQTLIWTIAAITPIFSIGPQIVWKWSLDELAERQDQLDAFQGERTVRQQPERRPARPRGRLLGILAVTVAFATIAYAILWAWGRF